MFWDAQVRHEFESFKAMAKDSSEVCVVPILMWVSGAPRVIAFRYPYSELGELNYIQERPYDLSIPCVITWGNEIDTTGAEHLLQSREQVLDTIEGIYRKARELRPSSIGGSVDIGFVDGNGSIRLSGKWTRD